VTRKQLLVVLSIAAAYVVTGIVLYRQRATSVAKVWDSDFLVFALSSVIAFVAFTSVLWPRGTPPSSAVGAKVRAVALAALATAISCWVYISIAFTRYGT